MLSQHPQISCGFLLSSLPLSWAELQVVIMSKSPQPDKARPLEYRGREPREPCPLRHKAEPASLTTPRLGENQASSSPLGPCLAFRGAKGGASIVESVRLPSTRLGITTGLNQPQPPPRPCPLSLVVRVPARPCRASVAGTLVTKKAQNGNPHESWHRSKLVSGRGPSHPVHHNTALRQLRRQAASRPSQETKEISG